MHNAALGRAISQALFKFPYLECVRDNLELEQTNEANGIGTVSIFTVWFFLLLINVLCVHV